MAVLSIVIAIVVLAVVAGIVVGIVVPMLNSSSVTVTASATVTVPGVGAEPSATATPVVTVTRVVTPTVTTTTTVTVTPTPSLYVARKSLVVLRYGDSNVLQYDINTSALTPTSVATLSMSSVQSAVNQRVVAVSPNSQFVAVGGTSGIAFLPIASDPLVLPFTLATGAPVVNPRTVNYFSNGSQIIMGAQDGLHTFDAVSKAYLTKVVPTGFPVSGVADLCVHPSGTYVYFVATSGNHLYTMPLPLVATSVTDLTANNNLPLAVTYHTQSNTIWVCNFGAFAITQYADAGATPVYVQDVSLSSGTGRPRQLIFNKAGSVGYILDNNNGRVYIYSWAVNPPSLLNTVTGVSTSGIFICLSQDENALYVTNNNANTITVIDLTLPTPAVSSTLTTTSAVAGMATF